MHKNIETVKLLITIGMDIYYKDHYGWSAFDHALKSGDEEIMNLTAPPTDGDYHNKVLIKKYKKFTYRQLFEQFIQVFGIAVVGFEFLIFVLFLIPNYVIFYMPKTQEHIGLHLFIISLLIFIGINWLKSMSRDPGFLPLNTPDYNVVLNQKLNTSRFQQFPNAYQHIKLCHTCKTVQKNRCKHCRLCQRCVMKFDHHCIYLKNCVGMGNAVPFFLLNIGFFLAGLLGCYLVLITCRDEDPNNEKPKMQRGTFHWFNFFICAKFLLLGFIMSFCALRNAAKNMTQYEEARRWKYFWKTLDNGEANRNPFDKGLYQNLVEHFKIV